MRRLLIWKAQRALKSIEKSESLILKFKDYIKRTRVIKKKEVKKFNKLINQMTDEEYMFFAWKSGYVEK